MGEQKRRCIMRHRSDLTTVHKNWETIGTLTAQQAAPGVDARDFGAVQDLGSTKVAIWDVPNSINIAELRFQTKNNGDSHVINVYVARGAGDHFVFLCTLTLTGGTQDSDSEHFVDTIVKSNERWFKKGRVVNSSNNEIARYWIDLLGYSQMAFVATTYDSDSDGLTIEGSGG